MPGFDVERCSQEVAHQNIFIDDTFLPLNPTARKAHNLRYSASEVRQKPGQMLITWPGVYYSCVNTGFSIRESVNFGTKEWLETEARLDKPCTCEEHRRGRPLLDLDILS